MSAGSTSVLTFSLDRHPTLGAALRPIQFLTQGSKRTGAAPVIDST